MTKGSETLASLVYTRNKDEDVTKATSVGLPGEEKPAYTYDEDSRITKGAGVTYKYDEANNPTTIGNYTLSYNAADEPEKEMEKTTTKATYTYNEVGERTKTTPATSAATTYEYNQAGDLTGVSRPKEGSTPAIEDTYTYNGDGLRIAKTASGVTTYFAWDLAESLPLVFSDGTNNYIYGPNGEPVEQVSSGGTVTFLHHDQQGSIRLLTNEKGEKVGSETYNAYGAVIEKTGTSASSFGYDSQYTEADTGFIYLRARYYDPATGQFVVVDPTVSLTGQPYTYAEDDPLTNQDPTGLCPSATAAAIRIGDFEECQKLQGEIVAARNELARRAKEIEEDRHQLPATGKNSIAGHQQQFRNKHLRWLLGQFNALGCNEVWGVEVPHDAWEWATKPTPSPKKKNGELCVFGHCFEPIVSAQ